MIVRTKDTLNNKPRIDGTRISVETILNSINKHGIEWTLKNYPDITISDIDDCLKYNNFIKMNENLIELVDNNLDLPIFAWVNGEICEDDCGYWLGQFGKAEIREYAKVESYGWHETGYVFKDDYEDYLDYLLDTNENLTEEEAENQILNLDYKKAIFVYIDLPDKF